MKDKLPIPRVLAQDGPFQRGFSIADMAAPVTKLNFWGVRGSTPTVDPATWRYGGNTPCLELEAPDGTQFILDCGTGLRMLGNRWVAPSGEKSQGTHILITHGPPFGTLDRTPRGDHAGCEALAARLKDLRVRLHVFGHIHDGYGVFEHEDRISVNASICDERYVAANEPVVVELN